MLQVRNTEKPARDDAGNIECDSAAILAVSGRVQGG